MLAGINRRHLLPILLSAALILATAFWPSRPETEALAAPAGRSTYTMVVPAAAFVPGFDGQDYVSGGYLSTMAGLGYFVAPLSFPQSTVTVRRITLHAYDNGSYDLMVGMLRERPAVGGEATMASLTSSGESATDPRSFSTSAVTHRTVDRRYNGVYLLVTVPAGVNYKFYGVTIRYQA